jgi:hypothetical protein
MAEQEQGAGGEQEQPAADEQEPQLNEEEARARIEESLRRVRVQDVLLESVVTLINLTARRIAKDDERDLDQARVGIEAVRALSGLLEPDAETQVRTALSEIQMLYARQAGGQPSEPSEAAEPGTAEGEPPPAAEGERGRSGKPPPGLWVPPGSAQ